MILDSIKKVLFFSPLSLSPHYEVELDLIEKYLRENYQVTLLSCDGNLPSCIINPYHKKLICFECKTRKSAGLKWVGDNRISIKPFYNLTKKQDSIVKKLAAIEITSLKDLAAIELEGSDIGIAAWSSLSHVLRDAEPNVYQHAQLIKKFLQSAAIVHFSISNQINNEKPDEIVAFNGRFAEIRPVVRAAWKAGIKTYLHEVAGVAGRYLLAENGFLHNLKVWEQQIESAFESSALSIAEKRAIAFDWFNERRNKSSTKQFLFTDKQQTGLLPKSFSSDLVKVTIFNSSEDEFVGFENFQNPFYKDQNDGIKRLVDSFKGNQKIKFYLRVHPYLANRNTNQTRELKLLEQDYHNIEVILPESPFSTYSLIDNSDLVLTFGSTVGIEAVFAGKPSVLMGRSVYENLGGVIKPRNHDELISIIEDYLRDKTLPNVSHAEEAVIKYGFFMQKGGFEYEYAKAYDWVNVKMLRNGNEQQIKPSLISMIINKMRFGSKRLIFKFLFKLKYWVVAQIKELTKSLEPRL